MRNEGPLASESPLLLVFLWLYGRRKWLFRLYLDYVSEQLYKWECVNLLNDVSIEKCLRENVGNVLSRDEAPSMVVSNVELARVDCGSSEDVRCW